MCLDVLFRKKGKKEEGKKKETRNRKKPHSFLAGITFLTLVTTDVLSRLEFELREASLNQTPFERSSMKEQQALEGEQKCPQEHEQQLAS